MTTEPKTLPPRLEVLSFSANWNRAKLDCDCFTTLRLSGRFIVGQRIEIWLSSKQIGIGEIIGKKRLDNLDAINDWVARLDTGYSADECRNIIRRMYPQIQDWQNQPIYYYLIAIDKKSRPVKIG